MSRQQNPSMVSLRDGHLNLAQSGDYNFAVTNAVRITKIMLNEIKLKILIMKLHCKCRHTSISNPTVEV